MIRWPTRVVKPAGADRPSDVERGDDRFRPTSEPRTVTRLFMQLTTTYPRPDIGQAFPVAPIIFLDEPFASVGELT
jgi:hypothetical protein